jgi:hypothetical protein
MASGWKIMHGSFYGTGAQLDITKVGYRPSRVKLINEASDDTLEWHEGMGDGRGFKRLKAGAAAMIGANGIAPLANGFRLGADADLNVAGELVRYECFE